MDHVEVNDFGDNDNIVSNNTNTGTLALQGLSMQRQLKCCSLATNGGVEIFENFEQQIE